MAIQHGMTILAWQENLTEEDMPPRWMWSCDSELELWFDDVDARRKARFGDESDDEEVETISNDLAPKRR